MASSIVRALSKFSTCDVSDALLKLGSTNGGFLPDLVQRTKSKKEDELPIIGRAWTVQFASKSSSDKPNFTGHYIDLIPQHLYSSVDALQDLPIIPILSAPPRTTCAILGGIMALRASVSGAPAILVSGRVRDVDEMNGQDSTAVVFSRGLSIVGAGAGTKVVTIGTECEVEDYGPVRTGEIVMVDHNGTVIIPESIDIQDMLSLMQVLTEQDNRVKEDVLQGTKVQEAFKKWRTK